MDDQSPTIGKLAEALSKAQAVMKYASKDQDNPFFKSKYADLTSVWEVIREPLSKNGLAVIQLVGSEGDQVTLTTVLVHSSGEWIKGTAKGTPVKKDLQAIGSCTTYLRRYALSAIAGVSAEDDDGNAASGNLPYKKNKEEIKKELAEFDAHTREIAKETAEEVREKIVKLLSERVDSPFTANRNKAKQWMEEKAQTDFDNISIDACRDMYKAAKSLKA